MKMKERLSALSCPIRKVKSLTAKSIDLFGVCKGAYLVMTVYLCISNSLGFAGNS